MKPSQINFKITKLSSIPFELANVIAKYTRQRLQFTAYQKVKMSLIYQNDWCLKGKCRTNVFILQLLLLNSKYVDRMNIYIHQHLNRYLAKMAATILKDKSMPRKQKTLKMTEDTVNRRRNTRMTSKVTMRFD